MGGLIQLCYRRIAHMYESDKMREFSYENECNKEALNKLKVGLIFQSIVIETFSVCTRKCIYCPRGAIKDFPTHRLEDDVVYRILDEIAESFSGLTISFQYVNEPLLDKRIFDFARYIKKKAAVKLSMATNGDLISHPILSLLDECFDDIRITQHDKVLYCEQIVDDFIEKHPKFDKKISVLRPGWAPQNWGGIITEIHTEPWTCFRESCPYMSQMQIRADGETCLCCQDVFANYGFGNIKEYSLKELWSRAEEKKKMLCSGEHVKKIALCRGCVGIDSTNRKGKCNCFLKSLKRLFK
jgi:sulfatase maturation enzyme AslB (radical SAM superfamily)